MKITKLAALLFALALTSLGNGLGSRAWAVNILNPVPNVPSEPTPGRNNFNPLIPSTDSPGNLGKYQGNWNGWTGTPIAPKYFISAKHLNGSMTMGPGGTPFLIDVTGDGVAESFQVVRAFASPSSDLAIYRIDGMFPSGVISPLYTPANPNSNPEINDPIVVWGRGKNLNQEVRVSGVLKGWQWGSIDALSWGQNEVDGVLDDPFNSGSNELIRFDFTRDTAHGAVANEAALAVGDSGGGVFIFDGGVWKLAAVNSYVDGMFNTTNSGSGFDASLFDIGGLYQGSQSQWTLVTDVADDIPTNSYSTRISMQASWINGVLNDIYGDFDDDGDVDAQDIDILWNVIRPEVAGNNDPGNNDNEDLNGDGYVNEDDVDFLLRNILNPNPLVTRYGDADLDGSVGGLDFTAWRNRAGTGWAHGDFDGDGGIGGLDFTLWRTRPSVFPGTVGPHAGDGSIPAPGSMLSTVPEPATALLAALGLPALFALARRRRRGAGPSQAPKTELLDSISSI